MVPWIILKVDGTQADEAALKDLMNQVEELQAQKKSKSLPCQTVRLL